MSATRILQLVRDDHDRLHWRHVTTVAHRGRPEVVLSAWFHDAQPPPGTYRAQRPGGAWAEAHYTGLAGVRS